MGCISSKALDDVAFKLDGVKEDGLSTIVFDPTFSDSAKAVFAEAVKEHYYGHRLAAVRRIEKALEHLDFSPVEYAWLLVLRCLVDLRHQIRHVPKMLEHRRENHIRPEDKTMISAALWSYDILNETKEDEIEHHRVFDGKPTEHAARDMAACDLVIAAFQQHPIPLQGAAPLNDIQIFVHLLYYFYLHRRGSYGVESAARTPEEKKRIKMMKQASSRSFPTLLTHLLERNRLDLFTEALKLRFIATDGHVTDPGFDEDVFERLLFRATNLAETKRQRITLHWIVQYRSATRSKSTPHSRFDTRRNIGNDFASIGDAVHKAEVILFHDDLLREDRGPGPDGQFVIMPRENFMLQTSEVLAELNVLDCPWLYGRLCVAMIRYLLEDSQQHNPRALIDLLASYEATERIRLGPQLVTEAGNPNHIYSHMIYWQNIVSPTNVVTKPDEYNAMILKVYFEDLWSRLPPSINVAPSVADFILYMTESNIWLSPNVFDKRLPREVVAQRYIDGERLLAAFQAYTAQPRGALNFHQRGDAFPKEEQALIFHALESVEHARWQPDLRDRVRILEDIEQLCRPHFEKHRAIYEEEQKRVCYEISLWAYRIALAGAFHPSRPNRLEENPEWALVIQLLQRDWFDAGETPETATELSPLGVEQRKLVSEMDEKLRNIYRLVQSLDLRAYVGVAPHIDWQEFVLGRYYDGTPLSEGPSPADTRWIDVAGSLHDFELHVEDQLRDKLREHASFYGYVERPGQSF